MNLSFHYTVSATLVTYFMRLPAFSPTKQPNSFRGEVTRLRSRLRAVTRMLVMVVTGYLLANILDIIIAFWEVCQSASTQIACWYFRCPSPRHCDIFQTVSMQSLQELPSLYTVLSDISSFLPIAACALRLPIYTINDREIRVEVFRNEPVPVVPNVFRSAASSVIW